MAKKRRKLNKDFEKKIYTSKKNVELVLAKIYDIDDELKENYQQKGFDDDSEDLLVNYKNAFNIFESEFEI